VRLGTAPARDFLQNGELDPGSDDICRNNGVAIDDGFVVRRGVDVYAVISADIISFGIELTVWRKSRLAAVPRRTVGRAPLPRIMTAPPLPLAPMPSSWLNKPMQQPTMFESCHPLSKPAKTSCGGLLRLAQGQSVLQLGKLLRAIEIGLLAEVGRSAVATIPRPRVAVLTTGTS